MVRNLFSTPGNTSLAHVLRLCPGWASDFGRQEESTSAFQQHTPTMASGPMQYQGMSYNPMMQTQPVWNSLAPGKPNLPRPPIGFNLPL